MQDRLRARLVAAGVALVAERGSAALTLREIARRAGVSHGAPRRYFPTHHALLAAIAREGYLDLARAVAALPAPADPAAHLHALAAMYLDFARSRTGMFELMFRHDMLTGQDLGLRQASGPLFDLLSGLIGRARPGARTPAPVAAAALWANLHGIAQLWLWGSLAVALDCTDPGPVLRAAVEAHLRED
jgi:AcrR family transcriptional regulator